jgi:hypothetical protein
MRVKNTRIPIYGGKFTIIVTDDFKEVEKKYNLEDTNGFDAMFVQAKKGAIHYIIALQTRNSPGTVAHECMHACNAIFKDNEITPDLDNDEPQAYLLGWLVDECHKFLK